MKKGTISIRILTAGLLFTGMVAVSGQDVTTGSRSSGETRAREAQRSKVVVPADPALEEMKARQAEFVVAQEAQYARQEELSTMALESFARSLHYNHQNSSQLMLSKNYEGVDAENAGVFQIEESVRQIRISIDGSVKGGSIKIKLLLPGGEIFKEMSIDESADIRYSQSLSIPEEEKKYSGNWKYVIKASKAEGSYRMSINTN